MLKSKKIYPILNLAFKLIVALFSVGYLVYTLFYRNNEFVAGDGVTKINLDFHFLSEFIHDSFYHNEHVVIILGTILFLTAINWGAEVLKWKRLVGLIHPVSFRLAWKSILAGVAMSNITPYRVGSFFARVAFLPSKMRMKAVANILLGDYSQLIISISAGALSTVLLFISRFSIVIEDNTLLIIAAVILALSALGILAFILLDRIANWLLRITFFQRWKSSLLVAQEIKHSKNALILLLISSIRFLAIVIQYYLAFLLFGWSFSMYQSLLIISTFLLIYNFLPTFNIIEFGVTKSAVFLFLLETFMGSSFITFDVALMISCSSFLIWLVNLAIPAAIGSVFLFKIKLFQQT